MVAELSRIEGKIDTLLELLKYKIEPPEYYTTSQASERTGYCQDTIKKYCTAGIIKAELRKMSGRKKKRYYISAESLEYFMSNKE